MSALYLMIALLAVWLWACGSNARTSPCEPRAASAEEVASYSEVHAGDTVDVTVFFEGAITDADRSWILSLGGRIKYEWKGDTAALVRVPAEALPTIAADRRVRFVELSIEGEFYVSC